MSLVNSLLNSAAIIRDASEDGENTALRVGGFLVSLVQAIVASLPNSVVDGEVIDFGATDTSFIITLRTKDSDGQVSNRQITIPAATTAAAGLMTATDRTNLTSAINKLNRLVVQSTGSNQDKVMSQAAVTEALRGKQENLGIVPVRFVASPAEFEQLIGGAWQQWWGDERTDGDRFCLCVGGEPHIYIKDSTEPNDGYRDSHIDATHALLLLNKTLMHWSDDDCDFVRVMFTPDVEDLLTAELNRHVQQKHGDLAEGPGDSTTTAMSQAAVTEILRATAKDTVCIPSVVSWLIRDGALQGLAIHADGSLHAGQAITSGYIPVKAGGMYSFYGISVRNESICFYNAAREFMTSFQPNGESPYTFTAPEGSVYMRYSSRIPSMAMVLYVGPEPYSEHDILQIPLEDEIGRLAEKVDKIDSSVDFLLRYTDVYGVRIDQSQADPVLQRLGSDELHRTLPVQSLMRRCLLADNGTVNYYLDPNNSSKKEDGTDAVLDGSDGMVMVEIPRHWRRFRSQGGEVTDALISLHEFPGAHEVPKQYVSAFEATIDRTNPSKPRLASVINNTAAFRGGVGGDDAPFDHDLTRSKLGRAACNQSSANFQTYARNRGAYGLNHVGWNCYLYEAHKTVCWLYLIEFANRNSQADFNPELTANGFRQGGLGAGATMLNYAKVVSYFNKEPFIPCGITRSLGNNTGVMNYTLPAGTYDTVATHIQCASYRGIEHPFGHINKAISGANGITVDAQTRLFVQQDPAHFNYTGAGYEDRGEIYLAEANAKNISKMKLGEYGDIVATDIDSSGTSTKWWCDGVEARIFPYIQFSVGGNVYMGAQAGFFELSYFAASSSTGTRLCFLPEEETSNE